MTDSNVATRSTCHRWTKKKVTIRIERWARFICSINFLEWYVMQLPSWTENPAFESQWTIMHFFRFSIIWAKYFFILFRERVKLWLRRNWTYRTTITGFLNIFSLFSFLTFLTNWRYLCSYKSVYQCKTFLAWVKVWQNPRQKDLDQRRLASSWKVKMIRC